MIGMAVLLLVQPIVRHRDRFAQSDERGDGWSADGEHLDSAREHRGSNAGFLLGHHLGSGRPRHIGRIGSPAEAPSGTSCRAAKFGTRTSSMSIREGAVTPGLTTAPRADVLRVLLGACNETRHPARGQSALFRGSLGGRNRRAGGHHQTREAGSADVAVPCRSPRRRAPSGHRSNDRFDERAGDFARRLSNVHPRRNARVLMSCTFDTNILVYTLGQPADVKRQRAQSLIIRGARRQTAVLLLQSLAEFSYVATRKFGVSVAWC